MGLVYTVASIYQMTRGALVLFVGLFSVVFLKRHLFLYQWFALVTVVAGVAVVGLAGVIFHDHRNAPAVELVDAVTTAAQSNAAVRTLIGVSLIALAQIFTASQFVLEEWILERYALEPLRVVGWEGNFGLVLTMTAMAVMYALVGRTPEGQAGFFDLPEGWRQMTQIPTIRWTSLAIMLSIGWVILAPSIAL